MAAHSKPLLQFRGSHAVFGHPWALNIKLDFVKNFFYFMGLSVCQCVPHLFRSLKILEEDIGAPKTGAIRGRELHSVSAGS